MEERLSMATLYRRPVIVVFLLKSFDLYIFCIAMFFTINDGITFSLRGGGGKNSGKEGSIVFHTSPITKQICAFTPVRYGALK